MKPRPQEGYVLITVVVMLFLLAAMAVLLNLDSAMGANEASDELEAMQAEYVAEAAVTHARWLINQQGCSRDVTLTNQPFGAHEYSATVTMASGGGGTQSIETIGIDQDAQIKEQSPNANFGADAQLVVIDNNSDDHRALFRFDLSSIPQGAAITSAVMHIYVIDRPSKGNVEFYRVTSDWQEATVTWNDIADAFDDTAIHGIIAKDVPGAAFQEVNLTGLVQQWVNGVLPNYGVVLHSDAGTDWSQYASREYGNVSLRPYVEITVATGELAASPATIVATGALDSGVTRQLTLADVPVYNSASSSIVMLQPGPEGMDSYIEAEPGHQNHNKETTADLRTDSESGKEYRSLLQFDLSAIPEGALVLDATLGLTIQSSKGADDPVRIHRITEEWHEDDVTWISRTASRAWSTPGGSYDTTPSGSFETSTPGSVTADVSELVNGWVQGDYANFGMLLLSETNSGDNQKTYVSSDATADPSQRPALKVRYACECGAVCVTTAGSNLTVKLVVGDPYWPNEDDVFKKDLFESWGYRVDYVDDDTSGSFFDFAVADADVIYVSASVSSSKVDQDIDSIAIGVVNEESNLIDTMGFSVGDSRPVGDTVSIQDNTHYITSVFQPGTLRIFDEYMQGATTSGVVASGADVLASWNGDAAVVTLDTGAINHLGNPAPARRVQVPLGAETNINMEYIAHNGWLIVQRAIEWAAGPSVQTGSVPLLYVVGDPNTLTNDERDREALFESWGYVVTYANDDADPDTLKTEALSAALIYISESVQSGTLAGKLDDIDVPLVNEEWNLAADYGFSENEGINTTDNVVNTDGSHYITQPFEGADVTVFTSGVAMMRLNGQVSSDIDHIGRVANAVTVLSALDAGDLDWEGEAVSARRAMVPFSNSSVSNVTVDGLAMWRRTLEWVAGNEPGFLAHWKLDETNGNTAVDSVGGHDGTLTNGPAWGDGMIGGGLAYDGNDDAIVVPNSDTLALTGTMSFAAWVWSDAFGQSGPYDLVVSKGTVATTYAYYFGALGDEIIFGFSDGPYREFVTSDLDLATGAWHHIAATFDNASGEVRLYHNGVDVLAETTTYSPSVTNHDLYVGSSEDGADWDGVLDDVRIYERVLSAGEIADLAERPGPVAHWKLDETSGTTAVDSEGGHDGIASNTDWVQGVLDGALRFNSAADSVLVPHADELSITQGLTVAAWINNAQLAFYDAAVTKATSGSDLNYFLGTWERHPVFGFSTATDNWQGYYATGTTLSAFTWYHLAATFDNAADTVRIYVDGAFVQEFVTTLEPVANVGNIRLGRSAIGEFWPGHLDDVRIYDRVLDGAEIAALAGSSKTPVAHWELDESSGAIAIDSIGGHDGTLANGPAWVPGQIGNALRFDGGNDRINVPHDGGLNLTSQLTLSAWINADLLKPFQMVMTKGDTGAPENYWLAMEGNRLNFGFVDSGVYAQYTSASLTLQAGQWHHIAATFDDAADEVVLWVDGSPETFSSTYTPAANSQRLIIGSSYYGGEAFDGVIDDVRIYRSVLGSQDIGDLAAAGGGGGANYVEKNTVYTLSSSNSWQTLDLSTAGVPPNAVVEIAMENDSGNREREAGVRTVGGSGPTYDLHEAEGGGVDALTRHVQADASGRIQAYAENSADVRFRLLGYWVGGSYANTDGLFTSSTNNSWQSRNLTSFGVQPEQIVEMIVQNTSGGQEYRGGVRNVGSGNSRMLDLHEAENGGKDFHSVFVETADNVAAAIEAYAENTGSIEFKPAGMWVTPPGDYTEHDSGINLGSPTSNNTWQTVDLAPFGVPPNAVVQITLANRNTSGERVMGVRSVGSSLDRHIQLHEPEGGGEDLVTMHVKADASSRIQWYHSRPADAHRFYLMGWWELE